jgi:hypothetical protein
VTKILFVPFSLAGGVVAGIVAKKLFELAWGVFADEEAPEPKHREISMKKLIPALLLEGALFRIVRGFFDHGTRRAFSETTGSWPGEERPEPE